MKVDFVRHGQTEGNKNHIMGGITDFPLTEEGKTQAEKTLSQLDDNYHEIYCSDLSRCKQTAEILNRNMQLPIKYDPRLRERNFGLLEGNRWKDWDPTGEKRAIDTVDQKYDYRPFDGESFEDVRDRILDFIKHLKKTAKKDAKILVVTHGGIIRLLHHTLKGKIPETIHNGSLHEFEF